MIVEFHVTADRPWRDNREGLYLLLLNLINLKLLFDFIIIILRKKSNLNKTYLTIFKYLINFIQIIILLYLILENLINFSLWSPQSSPTFRIILDKDFIN